MSNSAAHSSAKRTTVCATQSPPLLVKDIMTRDPVSVTADITARELARVLTDNQVSGVPVIDPQDRVIGVVSRTDLLQWCVTGGLGMGAGDLLPSLDGGWRPRSETPDDLGIVEDFMTEDPIICTPDTLVSTVARRMADDRVHRVIVLDADGCLDGIVTSLDVLKAFPPD